MQFIFEEICEKRFWPDWALSLLPVMLNFLNIWLPRAPPNTHFHSMVLVWNFFPHFVKALELYLFVHEREVLVTWFLFGVQWAEKTGIQLVFLHGGLYGGRFSSQLFGFNIEELIRNILFVYQNFFSKARTRHFSFSRVLCVLQLFSFVVGAPKSLFTIKHSRKAITFTLSVLFAFFLS